MLMVSTPAPVPKAWAICSACRCANAFGLGQCFIPVEAGQDDDEFLAAVTRGQFARRWAIVPRTWSHLLEAFIASLVAIVVVWVLNWSTSIASCCQRQTLA